MFDRVDTSEGLRKTMRHAWDLILFLDYQIPLVLGMDVDPSKLKVLIETEKGPTLAQRAKIVKTRNGELAVLLQPALGQDDRKAGGEPALSPSGADA